MAAKKKKAQGDATSIAKEVIGKEVESVSRLPFEPSPTRPKPAKPIVSNAVKQSSVVQSASVKTKSASERRSAASVVPEVVNRRMVSRAAAFCGVPTVLALLTFVASYLAIAQDLFHPPTAAVLLVSLGFFGLGVLGLSYGPLSASWDEERVGNLLGLDEFKLNFGRLRASWREAKTVKEE